MKYFLALVLLTTFSVAAQPRSQAGNAVASSNYAVDLTTLLSQNVTQDGLVKYTDLSRQQGRFNSVLKAIETFNASTLRTDIEKLAFWMNAYNVLMLKNILDNPNVNDIFGANKGDAFFKTPRLVANQSLSLDQIENQILRRQSGGNSALKVSRLDPRIHVGLNCGAVSCPRLRLKAFTASNVNAELELAMREFVNSSKFARIEGNQLKISSLVQWFGSDFDANNQKAGDFLFKYVNSNHPLKSVLSQWLRSKDGRSIGATTQIGTKAVVYEYLWTVNRDLR
jgi:hypothetical protein